MTPLPKSELAGDAAASIGPAPLLAWTVEIHSMTCVVFAATKAKAQWIATKSYWEAYEKNGWPMAKAWRAKPYDKSRLRFEPPKAWSEDYVMDCINER
jgi:hypothetical protein